MRFEKISCILTSNLRAMKADGLVHREVYPVVPSKVEYSLTNIRRSLEIILDTMTDWGNVYKKEMGRVATGR